LKADFIASLPLQPQRLPLFIYFARSRDEFWSALKYVRPLNVTTSGAGEKRMPRVLGEPGQIEKKFLRTDLVQASRARECRTAAHETGAA
jgi:hypothetical protein